MGVGTALAVVSGVSSVMGNEAKRKANRKAGQLAAMGRAVFENIEVPTIEEQKIILQNPALMGKYSPEQVQFMKLNASAMENVKADPEAVAEQKAALQQMAEISEGGYTEGDKATMRQVGREVDQNANARRKTILNEMAQRGTLGSGMELAAQLQGNQAAMQQESEGSDRALQQAQSRALQGIAQRGSMASQLRSQDVGEQTARAQAKDEINRFNTQNRQQVAAGNVGSRNQAQQYNLANRQAQEDARVRARNQEEIHNKGLRQGQFSNEMQRASGLAGQYQAQAASTRQAGSDKAEMIGGIGNSLVDIGGSMFGKAQTTNQAIDNDLNDIMKKNKDIF